VTGGDRQLRRALTALCVTEITSWGTLYYSLPAMLVPLSHSTGWPDPAVMGAFSAGLLVSAVAGIAVGRLLDRLGPRGGGRPGNLGRGSRSCMRATFARAIT
jgi:MFS family permease